MKMCKTKQGSSFFPGLFINMLLNIVGLIPAIVLFILHFWLKLSIWWAVGAFVAWIIYLILWMAIIGWASRCGNARDVSKENKNPYSVGNTNNEA